MSARPRTALLLAALLALPTPAAAQDRDASPRLQKAILAEDSERDFERARALYQAIVDDESADASLRGAAAAGLARVLGRLGRQAEALIVGQRAKAWLQQPASPAQDRAVDDEIRGLIEILRGNDDPGRLQELVWYGERAVPALIAAVEAELSHVAVARLAEALLRIGGPNVERWLERCAAGADALRKRAVLRGYGRLDPSQQIHHVVLAPFARDGDPEVRAAALAMRVTGDWPDLAASLRHADARVRDAAWLWLTGAGALLDRFPAALPGHAARARELVDIAAAGPPSVSDATLEAIRRFCQAAVEPVECASLLMKATKELPIHSTSFGIAHGSLPADSARELTLDLARSIATDRASARYAYGRRLIAAVTHGWTRASMSELLEIATLVGMDESRFAAIAAPQDWAALFGRLAALRLDDDALRQLLAASFTVEIPVAGFAPLRDFVLAQTASREAMTRGFPVVAHAVMRLGLFDDEASLAWCEEFLVRGIDELGACAGNEQLANSLRGNLTHALLSGDAPARRMLRRRLAVIEGAGYAGLRNQALQRIAIDHDVEAAPLFAVGYQLGLVERDLESDLRDGSRQPPVGKARALAWLLRLPSWSSAERIVALDRVLAGGSAEAWEDLDRHGNKAPNQERDPATRATIAKHLASCPDAQQRRRLRNDILREYGESGAVPAELLLAAFADPEPDNLREALQSANGRWPIDTPAKLEAALRALLQHPNPNIASTAIRTVQSLFGAGGYDAIAAQLERPELFATAAHALVDLDPERAIPALLPRLELPGNAWTLCGIAKETLDRRFVPGLIAALRASTEQTRNAAKEALDAIEYLVSQSQRWQRLLDEAGLDADSAAEALLKQARSGEKAIRLAAIRSLGTLGKPETLPFLIQLMQDQDADVKAAAGAALEKINAKQ